MKPSCSGIRQRLGRYWLFAGASAVLLLVGAALADRAEPDRPLDEAPARAERRDRFSGSIRIRQEGGTLYCDFQVNHGKVTSGYCAHRGIDKVMYDIVGGWYDREHLTLLMQSPSGNLSDPYFSHINQFRRTRDGFRLEHTLFGYGKTEAGGGVYCPYVVDRLEENAAPERKRRE